jgi:hypothetical protein
MSSSTTIVTPGGSQRARRTEASASSSSSLGPFEMLNVKLRVVTPPRPLPLDSYDEKAYYYINELFGKEFQEKAAQIASESGIPDVHVTLKARVFRDDPLDTQPAICIVVDEWTADSPHLWQNVVERVKKYIDRRVVETPEAKNVDISVEMVAEDLVREKYLAPLDKEDATYPYVKEAWPCIKEGIFDILESFSATASHMTAIALFKLGPGTYFSNPKTVYVSVGYESPETGWPPVVERMQAFLDEFRLGLRAHMEHNIMGPRLAQPAQPAQPVQPTQPTQHTTRTFAIASPQENDDDFQEVRRKRVCNRHQTRISFPTAQIQQTLEDSEMDTNEN